MVIQMVFSNERCLIIIQENIVAGNSRSSIEVVLGWYRPQQSALNRVEESADVGPQRRKFRSSTLNMFLTTTSKRAKATHQVQKHV